MFRFEILKEAERVDWWEDIECETFFLARMHLFHRMRHAWVLREHVSIIEVLTEAYKHGLVFAYSPVARRRLADQFPVQTQFIETAYVRYISHVLKKDKKLLEFQVELVRWLVSRTRSYLSADTGLGKTVMSLVAASCWFKHGRADAIQIIAPAGLALQWKREMLEFLSIFNENDIVIVDRTNKQRPFERYRLCKVMIVQSHIWKDVVLSYKPDNVAEQSEITYDHPDGRPFFNIREAWNKKSPCLIIDEAPEFKKSSAEKSEALKPYVDSFGMRILLSATPALNRVEHWWNQLDLLDPGILARSEDGFRKYVRGRSAKYNAGSVRQVMDSMANNVKRLLKRDIPGLPDRITNVHSQTMPGQLRTIYQRTANYEMNRLKLVKGEITSENILMKFPYQIQVLDNAELLAGKIPELENLLQHWKFEDDPRVPFLDKYLEEHISGSKEKVIIYDTHPQTLESLAKRYGHYGFRSIHGGLKLSPEARSRIVDEFNDTGSGVNLLFLSLRSCSSGLNLQKGGRRIVIFSMPLDATEFVQAIDRTHRVNSTRDTIVECFYFRDTLDEIRFRRCEGRATMNEEMLGRPLDPETLERLLIGMHVPEGR